METFKITYMITILREYIIDAKNPELAVKSLIKEVEEPIEIRYIEEVK